MKQVFLLIIMFVLIFSAIGQSKDELEIRTVLNQQILAWNKGSIEEFMRGYWNNDSLQFIGKTGIVYGYQHTLNNYKSRYSNTNKMGKLFFDILEVKKLSGEYCFVVGKWFVKRNAGNIDGYYTLLFRKINERWLIICDHSS